FILLVFLVFLVNLNYTWEMSTWLSFFINLHHYTGITRDSRQKPGGMPLFCLPVGPNSGRADSKVEQNLKKSKKCSTAGSKIGPHDLESRTKSPKIRKMFYSVTFAKAVWSQITGKSQKSRFARNRSQVQ
ncbi:hypothetical protein ACTQ44_09795, partial [Ligilactobacillus ruminis]|uniref:hypothetical protein n=1 Tax=Ligilactobacillus ruminis TaxID=1623 RepID=UPI003F9B9797